MIIFAHNLKFFYFPGQGNFNIFLILISCYLINCCMFSCFPWHTDTKKTFPKEYDFRLLLNIEVSFWQRFPYFFVLKDKAISPSTKIAQKRAIWNKWFVDRWPSISLSQMQFSRCQKKARMLKMDFARESMISGPFFKSTTLWKSK